MRTLKNLIQELDELLDQTHGQLNTEVHVAMKLKVDQLIREIDTADAARKRQITSEALRLLASLLSVVTNVLTLLK
jgi:hypothetical protein